ncbi:hypothetical protein [Mesorhizobium marinum]|uniref:hypothetical protein n=1 Tax=Mesorhizobium marinum TaxID=3228790 RepID=UPI0034659A3F
MPIDTDDIKSEMQVLRSDDAWQQTCMNFCASSVGLFKAAAEVSAVDAAGEEAEQLVVMQVLGIRVLNAIGATDELLLRGYFQPAAIMIRDIVECCFLLDLFSRKPDHLPKWIALGIEAGLKEYRPGQVRELLNEIDGVEREVRGKIYTFYSRQGTHPNPAGIGLIAPSGAVEIGPFSDKDRLKGLTYDLTRFSVLAATHLSQWIIHVDLAEDAAYANLGHACEEMKTVFLGLDAHLKLLKIEMA